MKKTVSFIVLSILTLSLYLPLSVSAATEKIPNCCKLSESITIGSDAACSANSYVGWPATDEVCTLSNLVPDCPRKNWGLYCLLSSIKVVTDWVFTGLLAMVVIFILYGAFKLLKSGGDSKKIGEGRLMIVYAAVGMIVALLAKAIPSLVRTLLS